MDTAEERMVSTLTEHFPCLEFGPYMMEELRLILGKSPKEMEDMVRRSKMAVEVLLSLMTKKDITREVNCHTCRHLSLPCTKLNEEEI